MSDMRVGPTPSGQYLMMTASGGLHHHVYIFTGGQSGVRRPLLIRDASFLTLAVFCRQSSSSSSSSATDGGVLELWTFAPLRPTARLGFFESSLRPCPTVKVSIQCGGKKSWKLCASSAAERAQSRCCCSN